MHTFNLVIRAPEEVVKSDRVCATPYPNSSYNQKVRSDRREERGKPQGIHQKEPRRGGDMIGIVNRCVAVILCVCVFTSQDLSARGVSHLQIPSPQPPCCSCHLGPSEVPLLQDKLPYRGGGSPGHTISHSHGFSELGYKGACLRADIPMLWSCQSSECFISHTSRPFIFCPRNTKFFEVGV